MPKSKGKFKPYEKVIVRHIYGIREDGSKKLLYADEISYTIGTKRDENLFQLAAISDGTDLLSEKIKLEMFDKDEIAQKTRSE